MILQPPSVLLQGAPGSGKTDSCATFVEAGLDLFVISTEPDGIASLIDSITRRKLDLNRVHWTSVLPATGEWSALDDMVRTIAVSSFETIAAIKTGVGKDKTRAPAMKLLNALKDFVCERTGEHFGDVATWGSDRALVLDSLSGLSLIAWMLTVGFKPSAHQGEWGVAMNFIEQLLLKLSSDRRCFFALTAHIEKEPNPITGASQVMASTLGRKLAPKIPRFFSEVVYATRTIDAGKPVFRWSTIDANADLKNRSLPIGDRLEPTFVPVVRAYREREKFAGERPQAAPTSPQPKPAIVPSAAPMTTNSAKA